MSLTAEIWQQQTMKLSMSQELAQAIELLQYSTLELMEFIENIAMENPLIILESNDKEHKELLYRERRVSKGEQLEKVDWLEQFSNTTTTLADHLKSQVLELETEKMNKSVVYDVIESLDGNGYLHLNMEEMSSIFGHTKEELAIALEVVRCLEPLGVGARTLQECLLIQLKFARQKPKWAEVILSSYFTNFAEKQWKHIVKEIDIELKDIQAVFDFVQTLNPRPGAVFDSNSINYIVPDVIINSEGCIEVTDHLLPKIIFDKKNFEEFSILRDKETQQYLEDKQKEYEWLMNSLGTRKETILKVVQKIIEKQQSFFYKGPDFLKPLTMREVSNELGIHESTVSRSIRGKYAQTPFGTMELKSLFSTIIKTTTNENTSSDKVKISIKTMIDQEDKQNPYSDQYLVDMLRENEKMVISRRTIAKYRDQLNIPSSSKRRRYAL
ncbi:RNA polymerase factor sigma-54 [Niallia alba]|uniref:RNA polymerase factor sigma-54 n=1 Tax=Niallia alba TaxID=2729105 RepID=UPI0039A10331